MAGKFSKTVLAAVSAAVGLMTATIAEAAPRFMQTGSITSQPIGHYEFCERHPDECSVKSINTGAARLTDYGWNVIREINVRVNHEIMPMTDMEVYGRDEVWAYPTDAGDCEDFALLKRRDLIQHGFAPTDLLITVVRKPDGEGHAVLTLRASDGDYILDNLEDTVKLWSDTPYRFLKRQAAFNTGRWVTIENSDEVVVGAVAK
jgi:predicted transglutaminase-like cysteine proteinase